MSGDGVDYAVPAAVPSSRRVQRRERRESRGAPVPLWGGRPRQLLVAGCWVLAAALLAVLLVRVAAESETGADSPEAAVEQLLQGIADVDPVAVVGAVDPQETRDPARARAAYDRLSADLTRRGEVPPAGVTAALEAAEGQVGGSSGPARVAVLADVDLDLDRLDLLASPGPRPGTSRVLVVDGVLDVSAGGAAYAMPLAEGWRARGAPTAAVLTTVERDGRWYVSLEATATDLLGAGR